MPLVPHAQITPVVLGRGRFAPVFAVADGVPIKRRATNSGGMHVTEDRAGASVRWPTEERSPGLRIRMLSLATSTAAPHEGLPSKMPDGGATFLWSKKDEPLRELSPAGTSLPLQIKKRASPVTGPAPLALSQVG